MKLKDKILDERNIFNSIFCMESYVFDKGLLGTDNTVFLCDEDGVPKEAIAASDLELYYALADKHNVELIEKVIACCRLQLEWLFAAKENLFEINVYFKLKNYDADEKHLNFRPLHTARLIDLICMVSILNCLMFDDDLETGKRKLSDLSKLLPHNFYGNIPCTDMQFLFHKWQTKYKEYTDDVIKHCRAYQQNHNYLTEVCLDIKNFFPSISPKILYDYILHKLSKTYEEDMDMLGMVVAKLLYFRIEKGNIEPWKEYYYPEGADWANAELYMNCGIPQGLPQSYFFGNLCMIGVKQQLMVDECFKGDAYFYVDDSVIYIKAPLNEDDFAEKISNLNVRLETWCTKAKAKLSNVGDFVDDSYLAFHDKLNYCIKFHESGKSIFTHIDNVDNQYGTLAGAGRQASMHSKLVYNMDEIDDRISLKKLKALDDVISREIEDLNQKQTERGGDTKNADASRLKLLKRLKKFFLYRNRLLKIRDEGGPTADMIGDFQKRFLDKATDAVSFFEQFDEDIFISEYRLLIQKLTKHEAQEFMRKIVEFEHNMLKGCGEMTDDKLPYLFYKKDVNAACRMKSYSRDIYTSLVKWARENFGGLKHLRSEIQMDKIRSFLTQSENADRFSNNIFQMQKFGFKEKTFTLSVINASAEYQRRILNVYFSEIMDVASSDSLAFTKMNARRFKYVELRILAYLRNRHFNLEQFEEFIEHIEDKDISNQMGIDVGVLEVLNVFIRNVRNPEWVDSLIVTHRLVKGLWYNGSKFLNSYTLHNEEHAVTLVLKSLELTRRIDYFVLKDIDFYILFLACYLHDISMVIHPDLGRLSSENGENLALISNMMFQMQVEVEKFFTLKSEDKKNSRFKEAGKFLVDVFNGVYGYFEALVRDNHAKESAKFIRERSDSLLNYLEPALLSYVAKVSASHSYDVMDIYGLKSRAKDDTVGLKYLMILIRLADLLDVANDRVNYHLLRQNLKNLSPISQFHWISHLVTDRIKLDTDYIPNKDNKSITEIINLELCLNVKQLTVADKEKKCEGCQMMTGKEKDCLHIEIRGGAEPVHKCDGGCTILCYWMMSKHDWLIKELIALKDYLFSVNDSLFQTQINFIIRYRDEMKLDADMFDSVKEHLGA